MSLPAQEENVSSGAPAAREQRVIFSRGEREVTALEVIDWALVQGELGVLWRDFLHALECDRRANEEALEIDDTAVDEAAVAFRYQHDLITAEETERWLTDRALTLSEFGDYFGRQYWARTYKGKIAGPKHSYFSAALEDKDLFLIDLTLSGELDRLAEQMSFQLAALAEEKEEVDIAAEREQFVARAEIQNLHAWLEQIGRSEAWLDEMLAARAAFQRRLASAVDEKALERELLAMQLNLTRFELETIEVDSRDAAAEVIACVRSDGMEMSEIAEESRYPFRRSEVLLEDLPAEQQQSFLSVGAGALLGPVAREDGFEVCRVASRAEPHLTDALVRERLTQQITRRHFSHLVSKHIDWRLLQTASEE